MTDERSAATEVQCLLDCVTPRQSGERIWSGPATLSPGKRMFGGQIVAQGLAAAQESLRAGHPVSALHVDFLRPGDTSQPVEYVVDVLADSRSTGQRRVSTWQSDALIATMTVGFAAVRDGLEHQRGLPDVPRPAQLVSAPSRWAAPAIPKASMDFRYVEEVDEHNRMWFKTSAPVPDDPRLHVRIVSFISDLYLCEVILRAHGRTPRSPGLLWGSADHSMWWHRPLRADRWLLLDIWSPSASGGRGLVLGDVFDERGALVASLAQQSLLRLVT